MKVCFVGVVMPIAMICKRHNKNIFHYAWIKYTIIKVYVAFCA